MEIEKNNDMKTAEEILEINEPFDYEGTVDSFLKYIHPKFSNERQVMSLMLFVALSSVMDSNNKVEDYNNEDELFGKLIFDSLNYSFMNTYGMEENFQNYFSVKDVENIVGGFKRFVCQRFLI